MFTLRLPRDASALTEEPDTENGEKGEGSGPEENAP